MKKFLGIWFVAILMLVACNTIDEPTETIEQGTEQQAETLILYKSDANAEHTMPFEVGYTGDESGLVSYIFTNVNEYDVELLDYTFENDNKGLVLDLGDDVYTIQGSAGANMFVSTLAKSYFENFPDLQEITFIYKGSYESILDHMEIGTPYKREAFDF